MTDDTPCCPECNEPLGGNLGRVPAAVDGDAVRVAIECRACATLLELSVGGLEATRSIETAAARGR